jgi:phosphomannomutase
MAQDPDPATRAELEALLDSENELGLRERFAGSLTFGTAGLRAPMGAGPNRMNRLVVRRATVGLMRHLGAGSTVVIGHDARRNSTTFAHDTAAVVEALGGTALMLPPMVPTPLVAFAVRVLGADAGIVCTASHNPASDNGYKLYLGDGAQVIPPVDREIALAIDAVPDDAVPAPDDGAPSWSQLDEGIVDQYVTHALGLVDADGPRSLGTVYSPLHGVGADITRRLFVAAGFPPLHIVESQVEPDPDFPTVTVPNPERPEAVEQAGRRLIETGSDIALVHDPDADRLGVLVPRDGDHVALTGNQIGILLADHVLRRTTGSDRLVVDTVVSSRLLESLARQYDVHHARTLTGFKWIVRPAMQHPEWRFVFGYEEALGYSVDEYVRDKDGMTEALVFAVMAAELRAAGQTVWDRLEEIHRRHGLYLTDSWSVGVGEGDAGARKAAMARLMGEPPRTIAGLTLSDVVDHRVSGDHPPTDLLELRFGDQLRVSIRPSGTEPRIKIYAEAVVDPYAGELASRSEVEEARALLERVGRDTVELARAAMAAGSG